MNFQTMIVTTTLALALTSPVIAQTKKPPVKVDGPHGTFNDFPLRTFKSDAARITQFRRQEMRSNSGHFRALEAVIRYGAPFRGRLLGHVDALQALAVRLPENFIPGTAMAPGSWGAKPEVWSDPGKFKKHVEGFRQGIANLKSAIVAKDVTKQPALLSLVRHECLACHAGFRARRRR